MIEKNSNSAQDHQQYVELCALATTGTLNDQEWKLLKSHLTACAECNKLVQQYREIARTGMALLMPDSASSDQTDATNSWSPEAAKTELFARIARNEMVPGTRMLESQPHRNTVWSRLWTPQFWFRPQYALALMVVALIAASGYRFGATRTAEKASTQFKSSDLTISSLRAELDELKHERSDLDDSIRSQSSELRATSELLAEKSAEVESWRASQREVVGELQRQSAMIGNLRAEQVSTTAEREALNRKLQESQAALQAIQLKYDTLREQNSAQLLRTASLETKINDLSARLTEEASTDDQERRLLASDRDIRELMGARDLYIADVYDVDQNGKTQKPFGRAFYTRGKSLIFYAFDLDQQPHLRNASIFQAWGRRGLNDKRPLNMGIFYLDNENNRRWVLKFDDPEALAQLDAVFVTVEPRGGSQKPSGKQLLFASLRSIPNHP